MADRRARPAAGSAGSARKGDRRSGWRRALPPPTTPPVPPASRTREPAEGTPAERAASVVEAALYQDGVRVSSPATLADTYRELREAPAGMAWIGLARPTEGELLSLAAEFDLHPLAVEDAMEAHQRPKLERYGDTLFVVLRAARYLDASEEVDFGELHVFVGPDFVITVRHGAAPDLSAVRRRMEETPELLRLGPEAVLYAILDAVVDGYAPVVAGVQNDVDEIETEVFRGDPAVSRRIYELSREMVEFQRATRPLVGMLHGLMAGFTKYETDDELQRYLRDVADHVTHTSERVDGFRQALTEILTVNATLVTQQQNAEMRALAEAGFEQNEEIKKISSWAAILFAPTLVGTIYGMNFRHMPELRWVFGYPFAIVLMAVVCTSLYVIFKRRDWL
ncbi:magnesium and cobalt transport protein CorA [Streptomyces scabiei]|uniref:magnesium and cobalt transport protein CorA n=1 Tax=Streptomyces TaxID=1883 RepID=UPI000996109A|nr:MULTISPECIES: magnesium and cobalt transport protein CorA [Streptomyces]MBP5860279.1 magnesium and cobalt transport protein CorA [Streptomyces sp. LBUM 1484]MBP5927743.1 magnesium and cobalt transport protein CorA [Streptomyces sp. LBUM 1479]MBP5879371.1 magnesium and cobalt transport protein CorA [Streptomyces sp. LBUM 1477]MBP5887198.1 magnesium and cobalt transport protein CorA [Streptomyces sp. LBUM 1487]MBP5890218.1 magnesium and cobalt transport protein CorA [Streptomyces sp. LBUM 148